MRVCGERAGSPAENSFEVNLLARGVSIEDAAALLGNSGKIAERHYAPFVKVADRLERAVRRRSLPEIRDR
jgi:hypothetical protein